jgi:hypothetical protein
MSRKIEILRGIVESRFLGGGNRAAPENAPGSVKTLWDQMRSLCQARDGRRGLENGEVDAVVSDSR